MPPKKAGASKKTEAKKKERLIEDKTFGLKNKKGGKQQKFIEQVEKQVKTGGPSWAQNQEKKKGTWFQKNFIFFYRKNRAEILNPDKPWKGKKRKKPSLQSSRSFSARRCLLKKEVLP